MKFGYYSREAEKQHGSHYYKTPDGLQILVTTVGSEDGAYYGWADKIFMGPVTDYVRPGYPSLNLPPASIRLRGRRLP